MSSHNAPRRNAAEALTGPIDATQSRAYPCAHQPQNNVENLVSEAANVATKLTQGPFQTQCVFGNEDVVPGTSVAGVSGRLGDPKLASMQKMVLDSVPEGSQVKIIYIITKENGNNDLRAGTANNAAAAQAGPSEVDRFVQQNNAVQDRIRAQIRQHRQGEDHEEENEDSSLRPRKRRRASCRVSSLHMSPRGLKTEQEDGEKDDIDVKPEHDTARSVPQSIKYEEENLEEHSGEDRGFSQQQIAPGSTQLSPAEMLAHVRRERLMLDHEQEEEREEQAREQVDNEVNEETDLEALFFAAPDDVINRSIPGSHAMPRMTPSLRGLPWGNSFASPARIAQQTNASDNNYDGNKDDGKESLRMRYTGGLFEDSFVRHAGTSPAEDPYSRLQSLKDFGFPGWH
ncbi:hypothetical protein CFIO01_09910 [Colletotrichum fioriniae PJ7]|uniref:Uncharacterized protein n=1 Tax=Colletotrichum fioriniae PJ7 TaxID=1445577 RepID=A0A010R6F9_9PEZI|nr:hypothetical protein CFIO01_09910 [Colletotrichum fioriniae PJ7]